MKAFKVWLGGFLWVRYVSSPPPAKQIPMWAIRWVLAGSREQRSRVADRCSAAVKR